MFLEDAQILPSSSMVQRPSRQVSSNIDQRRGSSKRSEESFIEYRSDTELTNHPVSIVHRAFPADDDIKLIHLLRSRFDADVYALNDVPKDKEKES